MNFLEALSEMRANKICEFNTLTYKLIKDKGCEKLYYTDPSDEYMDWILSSIELPMIESDDWKIRQEKIISDLNISEAYQALMDGKIIASVCDNYYEIIFYKKSSISGNIICSSDQGETWDESGFFNQKYRIFFTNKSDIPELLFTKMGEKPEIEKRNNIKFRAWHLSSELMTQDFSFETLIGNVNDNLIYLDLLNVRGSFIINPYQLIIMRYLGENCKDCNGIELCEGDIIEDTLNPHPKRRKIIFSEGNFIIEGFGIYHTGLLVKKIGNIYENPELLTQEVK